jgi:hypothetical protein
VTSNGRDAGAQTTFHAVLLLQALGAILIFQQKCVFAGRREARGEKCTAFALIAVTYFMGRLCWKVTVGL